MLPVGLGNTRISSTDYAQMSWTRTLMGPHTKPYIVKSSLKASWWVKTKLNMYNVRIYEAPRLIDYWMIYENLEFKKYIQLSRASKRMQFLDPP